ncbi:MAG: alkaline phosphatase [Cyclobacteriaceae bacterium]
MLAQEYSASSIFGHNDYEQPVPFYTAYHHQVGFIEADVFLHKQRLMVAHSRMQIKPENTLEKLYLEPLKKAIDENDGFVYPDSSKKLTLMVDLKTEGVTTLDALVKLLKKYPSLIACPTLQVAISGNVPDTSLWSQFPNFIYFDGRPGIDYNDNQLKRICLISDNFRNYAKWNGRGVPTAQEREKVNAIVNETHSKGKQIRFWAVPDFSNAWIQLMKLNVDILNTDNVSALKEFIANFTNSTFYNTSPHKVYTPQHQAEKEQTPKNIILMIGDGMGLAHLYGSYTANGGKLNIFNIKDIGFSITSAADAYNTDSAAGGTALAIGQKTNCRHISVDTTGTPFPSIAELLKKNGYNTALITSGDIIDATPAAFYAHQSERNLTDGIVSDLLLSNSDILIGSGMKHFKTTSQNDNLLNNFRNKNYFITESIDSLINADSDRILVLDEKASVSISSGRGDFLTKALQFGLKTFSASSDPFFIMLESAQIDWGGHGKDMEYVVQETLDFDRVVGEAMRFVDESKETLIIVTSDHETGGLSLFDGDESKGYIQGHFSTEDHTGVPVPVFAYGAGSELFRGVYQNTAIYQKIFELLKGDLHK